MTARVERIDSATPLPGNDARPVILVVEDDRAMRELLASVLEPLEARVVAVRDPRQALDCLEHEDVAVVVTDLRMPGIDGVEVVKFAKKCNGLTQAVVITGYATVESAVEALKNGAYDYLRKPFEPVDLRLSVERALQHYLLERENIQLRETRHSDSDGLIGRSEAINGVHRLIAASASYDCCVLICGESGTGKEVVARQIHQASPRRGRRFVALNCAAIPENIIESELFGYQKGAFTGADRTKPGLFETADGGTLFLDEINNAS